MEGGGKGRKGKGDEKGRRRGHTMTPTPKHTCVTISSPIVQRWLPSADLGSACKLAPQSLGLPQTKRLSMRVSWLILKLREVSSLSMGTICSFQKGQLT